MKLPIKNKLMLLAMLLFSQHLWAGWTSGANAISKSYSDSTRYAYSLSFPNGPIKWPIPVFGLGSVDLMSLNMVGGYDTGYDVNTGINFGEGVWDQIGSAPQLMTRTDLAFNAEAWVNYKAPGLAVNIWGLPSPLTIDVATAINFATCSNIPSVFDFRIAAPSLNFSLPFLADGKPLATIPLSSVGIYSLDGNGKPDTSLGLALSTACIPQLGTIAYGKMGAAVGFMGKVDLGLAGIDYYSGTNLIGSQVSAAQGVNVSQYAGGSVNVNSRDYRFALQPQLKAGISPFVDLNILGFKIKYTLPASNPALLEASLTLRKDFPVTVSAFSGNYTVPITVANVVQPAAPPLVKALSLPIINSVSPTVLKSLALPATQLLTIFGTGFTTSSTLEFVSGTSTFTKRIPSYIGPNELRYNIAVGALGPNWTVKVINDSAISNVKSFSVAQMADSIAPTVAIASPTSTATYISTLGNIALSGTALDTVGVTSVTWSNSLGGAGSAVIAGGTWSATSVPLVSGVNLLTIRATDAAGNSSSAQLSVSYNAATPVTLPTSPMLQSIVTSNGNYTVSWGPVTGATMYVLEEDLDGTFLHPTHLNTLGLSLAFSNKGAGIYYYRVSAVNASGQGAASSVQSAVVAYNQGPGEIFAATPSDGATNQPVSATLSWTAFDPSGGGLRYDVYFVQATTDIFFPNNLVSQGQTGTSFPVSNLPYNTPVSWGIKAVDNTGAVRYSRMFHFTTQAYAIPSTGSVSINAGALTTTSYSVILNTTANPPANGIRQFMRFSNDGVTYSDWQNVSSMFPWNLADTNYGGKAGLATYTVYAQYRDDQGNFSPTYTNTIDKVNGTAGNIILNGKFYEAIQDAINAANPGETVYLTEGVFTIPSSLTNSLYPQLPNVALGMVMRPGVSLKGVGPSKTTINFQNAYFGLVDADNATIEGINLVNSSTYSLRSTVLLVSTTSKIHNCIIRGGYYGIYVGYGISHPAVNNQISNNLIINNTQGLFVTPDSSNFSIVNNTIAYNTPNAGVYVQDGSTTILRNNIIAFNGVQISASATTALTIGNNDVFGTVGYNSGVPDQTGVNGNISADPLFVNSTLGNYQLSAGSPAVDKGANIGVPFSGSAPDMGAFEQNATGSIQLNTNQVGASFVIVGPQASYNGSGTVWSSTALPIGLYTISFNAIPNLYSPVYQSVELLSGQALVVNANYSADTTPPVGSLAVNFEEYATDHGIASLAFDGEDAVAGMGTGSQMKFSNDGVTWTTPEPYSTLKNDWNLVAGYGGTNTSGIKTVYAMISDALGNWATFTDTVLYVPNRQILNVPAQYSTIQVAVNAALPGDVVQVAPGNFCGNVTLLDGVTLRGSGGEKTLFNCVSRIDTAPNSQIEGVGGYIMFNASTGPTIIQNNISSYSFQQVAVTGAGRRIIRNNIFHSTNVTPTGIGVIVDGCCGAAEVVVENNSFINLNQAMFLQLAQPSTKIFNRNNIFASNNIAVIESNSTDTVHKHILSSFNTYWANISDFGAGSLYRLMEASDMNANPLFNNTSVADFHLQAASTSINSGNPDARFADVDLSRNDRGAYGGRRASLPTSPTIISEPQSQSVASGTNVTLSVKSIGSMTLEYQWSKNGTDILGATAQTLVLNNFSSSDVGIYAVTVTNQLGSITSLPAYVQLNTPVVIPTYALNVSVINGSVSKYPDKLIYPEGSLVTLTASPSIGFQFTSWGGDVTGTVEQLVITMNSPKNISANFVDIIPPSVPNGLTPNAINTTQINISWAAPTDNVGVVSYKVYRDGVPVGSPTATSFSDTGLTAGTVYSYTVSACDAAGNCSAQSAPVLGNTLSVADTQSPSIPTVLAATALSSSRISLHWNASTDNVAVSDYQVYRDGILVGSPSGLVYFDNGLKASTSYRYTVSACDAPGNCSAQSVAITATTLISSIAAGEYHSVAIKSDGSLWSWGWNLTGQLGDNTTVSSHKPNPIGTGYTSVATGGRYTIALKSDGSLWTWGWNSYGQLGDNTTTDSLIPKQIGTGYSAISAGAGHNVGLKSDGSIWAWGWNSSGQLGDSTTADVHVPKQIDTGYIAIAAGSYHNVGIKSDGSLWAWGLNLYGQLGDNSTIDSLVPKQIDTGYTAIAAGQHHTVALKADGSLWTWGYNFYGQLGDNTTTESHIPKLIGTGYTAIAAGDYHTLALKSDGTLWAWGINTKGQLGDNSIIDSLVPKQVDTGYDSIAAGHNHNLATKPDGGLWAWGANYYGELGDNTTTESHVPKKIGTTSVPAGDLTGNGVVDVQDALLGLRIAAGLSTATPADLLLADVAPLVNGKPQPDGKIDIGDVVVLLRRALGLVTW